MAKVKNKKNSGLADRVHKKRNTDVHKKKLNPFEVHINREKIKVLGKKTKHDRGLPGVSRAKAIQKRKETLGTEMKLMHKTNTFIDRRIGEKNSNLSAEERMVARFTAERAKQHSRKDIYNLADDEILTHRGQTLEQIEKFDDPRSDDDDDDEGKKFGGLDDDFVSEGHFGGGMLSKSEKDGAKSHKDLIEQLIAESKKRKAEKQKEKEQTLDLTEKLDSEWKDLQPVVFKRARMESEKESLIDKLLGQAEKGADYDKMMRELRFEKRGTPSDGLKTDEKQAKEEREKLERLEKERQLRMLSEEEFHRKTAQPKGKHRSADDLDDNFDLEDEKEFMLAYDKDGNPLVPEHILKDYSVPNAKPKFEDGVSDTSDEGEEGSDEESDDDEETKHDKTGEDDNDDDEEDSDDDSGDESEELSDKQTKLPNVTSKEVKSVKKETNNKQIESDGDSSDDSEDSNTKNIKPLKVTTKEAKSVKNLVNNKIKDNDEDDSDDESSEEVKVPTKTNIKPVENKVVTVDSKQKLNNTRQEDTETVNKKVTENGKKDSSNDDDSEDESDDEQSTEEDSSKKDKSNQLDDLNDLTESEGSDSGDEIEDDDANDAIFDVKDGEIENLMVLLSEKNPSQQSTAIQKLIKKYDPSLAETNKDKLSILFAHMLQYINDIFTNLVNEGDVLKSFLVFDKLAPYFYDLANTNKVSTKKFFVELLKEKHDKFMKNPKKVPNLDTLVFFKLVSILYPTSDFRHPVTTPSLIFMTEILSLSKFNSAYAISRGLFITALILEYTCLSKRLVPSAVNFLRGILFLSANVSILNPIQVVPPFRSNRDTKLLNLEEDCSKMAVGDKMAAKDLVLKEMDDDFKIRCLLSTTRMLRELFENYQENEAQEFIFEPHLSLYGRIELEWYPKRVACIVNENVKHMKTCIEMKTYTPLSAERKKPKALRLYEPDVQEVFTGSKSSNLPRELAERRRLQTKVKKEMKGALREIRRDKAYIASVNIRQKIRSDNIRKEKVKQIYKEAAVQQGEINKLKRMK